jgi:hypothetical protein
MSARRPARMAAVVLVGAEEVAGGAAGDL